MTGTSVLVELKSRATVTARQVTYSLLVPTKGLEAPVFEKFKSVGVSIEKDHPRSIEGRISGILPLTQSISCRSDLIPMMLTRGGADFGVTTTELIDSFVAENARWKFSRDIAVLAKLNIGQSSSGDTRLVFFGRVGDADTIGQASMDFDEEKEGVPGLPPSVRYRQCRFCRNTGWISQSMQYAGPQKSWCSRVSAATA